MIGNNSTNIVNLNHNNKQVPSCNSIFNFKTTKLSEELKYIESGKIYMDNEFFRCINRIYFSDFNPSDGINKPSENRVVYRFPFFNKERFIKKKYRTFLDQRLKETNNLFPGMRFEKLKLKDGYLQFSLVSKSCNMIIIKCDNTATHNNNNIMYVPKKSDYVINSDKVFINNGVILINVGSKLLIEGKLINNGIIINLGDILLSNTAVSLVNHSVIYNQGDVSIGKCFTNHYIMYNIKGGNINVQNTLCLIKDGYLKNSGKITIDGTIRSSGTIRNTMSGTICGTEIINYGIVRNDSIINIGNLINNGMLTNSSGANLKTNDCENHSKITINQSSQIIMYGFTNYGELDNHGSVYSEVIFSTGIIKNHVRAFVDSNTVANQGHIYNDGKFQILDKYRNMNFSQRYGVLRNCGYLDNQGTVIAKKILNDMFFYDSGRVCYNMNSIGLRSRIINSPQAIYCYEKFK